MEVAVGPKERIAGELAAARSRTLRLLELLSDDDLVRQHSPLQSPLVWDLAHIGHFEELWLLRRLAGRDPIFPAGDDVYDAFEHAREERPSLELLDPATARAYLGEVRELALEVLERTELDPADRLLRDGFVFGLVLQHEHQHLETMLQTLQLSGLECAGGGPAAAGSGADVLVAAGPAVIGSEHPFAYDNERPRHEVELPAFRIDSAPVTNAEYVEFLADGGWHEPPLGWRGGGVQRFGRLAGRGVRALGREAPADRGGVGEGGVPRAVAQRRRGLGVDGVGLPRLCGLRGVSVSGVQRGLLRLGLQGASRRLVGDACDRRAHELPELGLPRPPPDLRRVSLRS